jgi:imidazoleglycerol phosphate dehydratase HisB
VRQATASRETRETRINATLSLDGSGDCRIKTGVPFFDHMLHAMARHGRFDLTLDARGDLEVDTHHTIEDTGILLGTLIREAVGDGRGIARFGHAIVPMDEALATLALDCSGRGYLVFSGTFKGKLVGGVETDIFEHFFMSLCGRAGLTVHITFSGRNDHHQCEAIFKAFGISLSDAVRVVGDGIPSTKGTITGG